MTVRDGEKVLAGDPITDGSSSPHDILRVSGEKAVQEFLLNLERFSSPNPGVERPMDLP